MAAAALFAYFLRLSQTRAANSDGAANTLQAWDMLHGNLAFWIGVLPLAGVCVARGLRAGGTGSRRDELALAAAVLAGSALAVLAGSALAVLAGRAISAAGGFHAEAVHVALVKPDHLASNLAVTGRGPVRTGRGRLAAGRWATDTAWYDPRRAAADYVVLTPGLPGYPGFTARRQVLATFGRPARTYRVNGCLVLVWHRNLLAGLGRAQFQNSKGSSMRSPARKAGSSPGSRPG